MNSMTTVHHGIPSPFRSQDNAQTAKYKMQKRNANIALNWQEKKRAYLESGPRRIFQQEFAPARAQKERERERERGARE